MTEASVVIIGGGAVGLAIAAELASRWSPLVLLERHESYGQETSGRNSEVIHAGIYYPHGSLKARLCVEGNRLLYSYCHNHSVPHRRCGKIITGTSDGQMENLERLYRHGIGNDVELELLTRKQVQTLEASLRTVGGILSPSTGIISAHGLMNSLARNAASAGAILRMRSELQEIEYQKGCYRLSILENGTRAVFATEFLINAAGLEADNVARMAGIDTLAARYNLHWVKGSYFAVRGAKRSSVSRLVYPMPERESLGIHAVIDLGGGLRFGPDVEYLTERKADYSVDESKRSRFGKEVRAILPRITDDELTPDFAGIRAKLQEQGGKVRDFVISEESERGFPGLINLIGIDSPGLTSSLAIARHVRDLLPPATSSDSH